MIIGIDIDDTLTDSHEEIIKAWQDYYRLYDLGPYTSEIPSNINTGWNDYYIRQFWDLYRTEVAANAKIKEGAEDALYKLKRNGHILKIVTARPENQRFVTLSSLRSIKLLYDELILNARHKGATCKQHGIELHVDDTQMNLDDISSYGIKTLKFRREDTWDNVYRDIMHIARHK